LHESKTKPPGGDAGDILEQKSILFYKCACGRQSEVIVSGLGGIIYNFLLRNFFSADIVLILLQSLYAN